MRLCATHGTAGVEVFVYGITGGPFPARQHVEASRAVARTHGVNRALFVQQSEDAIAAGAFHNDVVAVSNGPVLMFHAEAFDQKAALVDGLKRAGEARGFEPVLLEAGKDELTLDEAVRSYLFNSQIVTLPSGGMALVLPHEVEETPRAKAFVDRVLASNGPVREANYLDLRQSMRSAPSSVVCLRYCQKFSPMPDLRRPAEPRCAALAARACVVEIGGGLRTFLPRQVNLADVFLKFGFPRLQVGEVAKTGTGNHAGRDRLAVVAEGAPEFMQVGHRAQSALAGDQQGPPATRAGIATASAVGMNDNSRNRHTKSSYFE